MVHHTIPSEYHEENIWEFGDLDLDEVGVVNVDE
jgi:hypothetical protein